MTWFGYVLIALWAVSGIVSIARVGKPRQPIEPGEAAAIVLLNGLLIWGVIAIGTNT